MKSVVVFLMVLGLSCMRIFGQESIKKDTIKLGTGLKKDEFETTIEQIHLPNRKNPVIMKKNDPLLHFIQHLRDESHRFAITYSRSLALKNITKSPLLQIEGMGEKRLKQLLTAIPDIHTRKDLTVNIIKDYSKIPEELAEKVLKFLEEEKSK